MSFIRALLTNSAKIIKPDQWHYTSPCREWGLLVLNNPVTGGGESLGDRYDRRSNSRPRWAGETSIRRVHYLGAT
jgi:hypothetical protein